jgi:hypothetical protein
MSKNTTGLVGDEAGLTEEAAGAGVVGEDMPKLDGVCVTRKRRLCNPAF